MKRGEKKRYMVDRGSVFNVIRDGSLVVEIFSRGLLTDIL